MNSFETLASGDAQENVLSKMESFSEHMAKIEQNGEQDAEKIERFKKFVAFFEKDASIKKELVELAPRPEEAYGDGVVDYSDRLYKGFQNISADMLAIMKDYYPSETLEDRLDDIGKDISSSSMDKLSEVYRRDFTDMSEDFNKKVRKAAIGYFCWFNPYALDGEAKSINEMLHLIHSSIVNNEGILQSLPVLTQSEDGKHFVYGTPDSKNEVALGIFDGVKGDGFATDIVAVNTDRTLMMVRDRGHALTVDIRRDNNGSYIVEYFVPKICNAKKVNLLPGVRKINEDAEINAFTTGLFGIDDESEVVPKVLEFLNGVPTDEDIVF